jgi:hypothetical protein
MSRRSPGQATRSAGRARAPTALAARAFEHCRDRRVWIAGAHGQLSWTPAVCRRAAQIRRCSRAGKRRGIRRGRLERSSRQASVGRSSALARCQRRSQRQMVAGETLKRIAMFRTDDPARARALARAAVDARCGHLPDDDCADGRRSARRPTWPAAESTGPSHSPSPPRRSSVPWQAAASAPTLSRGDSVTSSLCS